MIFKADYLGCFLGLTISVLLSYLDVLDRRGIATLNYISWVLYILFAKGG